MDAIDALLEEAWLKLVERVREDPRELERRLQRSERVVAGRAIRAWCLCLRASDTRIRHGVTAFFHEKMAQWGEPHLVDLPGWGLRALMGPVWVGWPGMRWTQAARKLGMHEESMRVWMKKGVFEVKHEYCRPHGYRGKPCPIVWAAGPLDPNFPLGRHPDGLWRTMWQRFAEKIHDNFLCTLERRPRFRRYRDSERQRGWDWVCPGRDGRPCGRTTTRLFAPMAVWTVGNAMGGIRSLMQGDRAVAPADPLEKRRTFACHRCWKVRYTDFVSATDAWNQFVTHISGGLLMGSEVPMPPEYRRQERRRRRYSPQINRPPSKRRGQVLELLLSTRDTLEQIGRRLGVKRSTVATCVEEIYRQHRVHGREELRRACGAGEEAHERDARATRSEKEAGRLAGGRASR